MDNLTIRELKKTDLESIRYIVVKTASNDYKDKPEETKLLFCDYYVEYGMGFVLEVNNRVVGYIIASTDYKKYLKIYKEEFLPKLKEINKKQYKLKKLEMVMDKMLGKKYPAHLHCDILEEYCGNGNGSKLMQELLSTLKGKGISGIWLGVDNKNTRAVHFYQKFGFTTNAFYKMFGIYRKTL